jgi:hypothetical protein
MLMQYPVVPNVGGTGTVVCGSGGWCYGLVAITCIGGRTKK